LHSFNGAHPMGNNNQFHLCTRESQGSRFSSARASVCYAYDSRGGKYQRLALL